MADITWFLFGIFTILSFITLIIIFLFKISLDKEKIRMGNYIFWGIALLCFFVIIYTTYFWDTVHSGNVAADFVIDLFTSPSHATLIFVEIMGIGLGLLALRNNYKITGMISILSSLSLLLLFFLRFYMAYGTLIL